eukprot:1158138-Pelagomonas_calceolata.AAC.3
MQYVFGIQSNSDRYSKKAIKSMVLEGEQADSRARGSTHAVKGLAHGVFYFLPCLASERIVCKARFVGEAPFMGREPLCKPFW